MAQFVIPNTHVDVVFSDHPDDANVASYAYETSASREEENMNLFLEDLKP